MPSRVRTWMFALAACAATGLAVARVPPQAPPTAGAAPPAPLTVFAAASLKESLDGAARAWTTRSGQRVVVSYAASGTLARQIEQGAPADVFVSADAEWMDYLAQRGHVEAASRIDLVGNRLVLVVPAASPVRKLFANDTNTWVRALGADGRLAVADVDTVPAGRYARQSLQALRVWPRVQARLAPADNVRGALAFVARGESPLGVVYATDARVEPKVRVVAELRDDTHAPIVYPAARVRRDGAVDGAGFLAFLRSPPGQEIFLRAGFVPVSAAGAAAAAPAVRAR